MTRCFNCGAQRSEDVCEACGMTSLAAELSLRKRLLNRTGLFLVGALAFVAASERYPALELDGILIFIGVLFFLTLGVAIWVERRALRHRELEALKRVYYGLIPVPWVLALLLFVNGALDASRPRIEDARVVSKFSMPGPFPSHRLIVASWRDGRRYERIPVDRGDFDRFAVGDTVEIHLREGLAGIPWISGVSSQ